MKRYLLFALLFVGFFSCKKEDSAISQEDIDKAELFNKTIVAGGYALVDYYSVDPIDYNGDGQTETDLNIFVSPWLHDDLIYFAGENVSVVQGEVKIPNDPSDAIVRPYLIKADADGVFLDFLSHEYTPLRYRLVSFTSSEFIVYASWNGKTVYSKFIKAV
jgi:hypothetical protein